MHSSRTTQSTSTPHRSDQEDWDLEILQALVSPSTPEDAALACAAAWMNFLPSTRVAVAVFGASDSCHIAHGQRDDSHLTIYVGQEQASIAALMNPLSLCSANGPCVIEHPNILLCWPEHFAFVAVCIDEESADEERLELIEDISRRLLSRWTSPSTSFASPAHMESVAEFSAGAGHEINNPLGSIIGQAQMLLKKEDRADHRQALETIGAQAWRIRDMIGDAMLFGRPPQPEFRRCDLQQIVTQAVAIANSDIVSGTQRVHLETEESEIHAFCDDTQISTLVSHLIRNACEATSELTQASVRVRLHQETKDAVVITIDDNGAVIPEQIRQHMFDPFFSGRQAGRGLGFGLCHCWQISRMHNGLLTHETTDQGNRFTVVLPADVSA